MRGYAELPADYDLHAAELAAAWQQVNLRAWLRPVCAQLRGRRVLDVGAGSGRLSEWLRDLGYDVTAVEPVATLWQVADLTPVEDTLPALRSVTRRFDTIVCLGVLHHLTPRDQSRALARMARALRPGGRLILALRHGPSPRAAWPVRVQAIAASSLHRRQLSRRPSQGALNRAAAVRWTWVVLERRGA